MSVPDARRAVTPGDTGHPHAQRIGDILTARGWRPAEVRDFMEALLVVEHQSDLRLVPRDEQREAIAQALVDYFDPAQVNTDSDEERSELLADCRRAADAVLAAAPRSDA